MKIKIIIIMMMFLCSGLSGFVYADPLYDDVQKFKENNPDGYKYDFVRAYLNALMYFKKNKERKENLPHINFENLAESKSVKPIIDNLRRDNVNLRIARNLVKKFLKPENGLILKVSDMFVGMCDDQIELNSYEKVLYEKVYEFQAKAEFDEFNPDSFIEAQRLLASQRHASLKDLLETAMMVNVILVSHKTDEYGDFYSLGITGKQRQNLLYKIDDFQGHSFREEFQEGQSFLAGSVNIIRQILENESWEVLR
jgi:hypothetical protein